MGVLDEWLYPMLGTDEGDDFKFFFKRLNIAIDAACAIEYLQHGDLRLTRYLPEAIRNYSTDHPNTIALRGSVGYTSPAMDFLSHYYRAYSLMGNS
ncbi:conserved hypothetical protein [Ricinus communis]|uniref:Uncharacterized protein n=1 Tax=Ricinus communis TaxID=3988 RepID=B9RNN1_RICCO|nr:conserved hypothetical protein [Ricinus communis]